eukprot:maker-scaffold_4-snap-gene-17.51-mRNA-1 protein AED:0.00 eAED:0.00 QI:77/1/1/1/0/0.5/2/98/273
MTQAWNAGEPTNAVVEVGKCQVYATDDDTWFECSLLSKEGISPDTFIFTFENPDKSKPLNLSTSACLMMKMFEGEELVKRPYTPCSTNAMVGQFQLMVKIYQNGKMTQLLNKVKIGEKVSFQHRDYNVKIQYPFYKPEEPELKFLGMIVGGTGITPMLQCLHAVLGDKEREYIQVNVLFSNKTEKYILAKETLESWNSLKANLEIKFIKTREGDKRIDQDMVEEHFGKASEGKKVFVCGPPPMYEAMCGPRNEKEVTGALAALGYDSSNVFKF